ncbi:MAG: MoaD/ThiS family protein [Pyrinomonadaceae bacterium]
MINVSVLFFGATADAANEREVEMSFARGATAVDAFVAIVEKYPQLKQHTLLFAVNQEYSNGDEIIKDGDELAVFTAVSGG